MQNAAKLLREGILLTEQAKSGKAIPKLKQALDALLKSENRELIALCRSFLGLAYRSQKQYDAALEQFNEFLSLITSMKDNFGVAQAHLDLGLTLSLKKQYDESISHLKICLKIIQDELHDMDLEVTALANLGGVYRLKGDFNTAQEYYQKGISIADQFDFVEGSAECHKGLAEIYEDQGDLLKAEDNFNESLGTFRILRDTRAESDILIRLGVIHSKLGQSGDALMYFKKSLKIKNQLKDILGQKICEKNIELLQKK